MSVSFKRHPLSAAFPDMPAAEFEELVADIKANGLRHAIMLFEGQILDGWHRYLACKEAMKDGATVGMRMDTYAGRDPREYVKSLNLMRRHLTASQRGIAVVAVNDWRPLGANQHRGSAPGADPAPKSTAELATEAGVSTRTIGQAKVVHAGGSAALKEAVKDGEISLKKAADIAPLPKAEQKKALQAPAAPKPKAEKPAAKPDQVAATEFEKLRAAYDEKCEQWQVLREHVATLESFEKGDQVLAMDKLREEIRVLTQRNLDLTNQLDQKQQQINLWKKRAGVAA